MAIITIILLQGYQFFIQPNFLLNQPSKLIFIPQDTSFKNLEEQLISDHIIKHPHTFRWLARLMRCDKRIFPGAYKIQSNMNNWQVMKLFKHGLQHPVKIRLHKATSIIELTEELTKSIAMQPNDLHKILDNDHFVEHYGFTKNNILTMFIPNTYCVYWNISPLSLFQRFHKEYQQFWTKERLAKAQKINLSPQEIYILASIVAKETSHITEACVIAGVYINRLKKGIKLQADPTITYITQQGRVLNKHTQIESPYNTYLYKGLPPGPITIPTVAMIDAVLNYQQHDYLYFVAKEDLCGLHHFTKTFQAHKIKAKKYRDMLKNRSS